MTLRIIRVGVLGASYPYLPATTSRAEVQLFTTAEDGAMVGEFAFEFTLGEECAVSIVGTDAS